MPFPLVTPRLFIRPFLETDLEPFLAYRSDPEVARYQGWRMPYTRERAEAFLSDMIKASPGTPDQWYQAAIVRQDTGDMIGDCAFYILPQDHRQAEIGLTLARHAWRQGYGVESTLRLVSYLFDELELHRVRANCDPANLGATRVLEQSGFRREGVFLESPWFNGQYLDEVWYAMLKREWDQLRPK